MQSRPHCFRISYPLTSFSYSSWPDGLFLQVAAGFSPNSSAFCFSQSWPLPPYPAWRFHSTHLRKLNVSYIKRCMLCLFLPLKFGCHRTVGVLVAGKMWRRTWCTWILPTSSHIYYRRCVPFSTHQACSHCSFRYYSGKHVACAVRPASDHMLVSCKFHSGFSSQGLPSARLPACLIRRVYLAKSYNCTMFYKM